MIKISMKYRFLMIAALSISITGCQQSLREQWKAELAEKKALAWLTDAATGCKVKNADTIQFRTVSWSGECKNGYANGRGRIDWEGPSIFSLYSKGADLPPSAANAPPSRRSYEGYVKDGKPEGEGTLVYYSSEAYQPAGSYSGVFSDGSLVGKGRFVGNGGCSQCVKSYSGNFLNGYFDGYGEATYANGETYKGQWKTGRNLTPTVFEARAAKEKAAADARAEAERAKIEEERRRSAAIARPRANESVIVSADMTGGHFLPEKISVSAVQDNSRSNDVLIENHGNWVAIRPGYSQKQMGGSYRYVLEVRAGSEYRTCTGVFNISGNKPTFVLRLYSSDCNDAGSGEY